MFCLEPTTPIGVLWGGSPRAPLKEGRLVAKCWPANHMAKSFVGANDTDWGALGGPPEPLSGKGGGGPAALRPLENHDRATQTQTLLNEKLKNYNI